MNDIVDKAFLLFFPVETELRKLCCQALSADKHRSHDNNHIQQKFWMNKRLCDLIVENQMLPILFETMVQGAHKDERQYLDVRARYLVAQSNIHQFAVEYAQVLRELTKNKIAFLVMKALPHLAPSVCFFHKEVNDLDILVSVSDFYKVALAMRGLKYIRLDHRGGKILKDQTAYDSFYTPKQEEFFYKHPYAVEVHINIIQTADFANRIFNSEASRFITQELYRNSQKKHFCGTKVLVLKKNTLLISLIIHALYNHNFQSVMLFYEVALLMNQKGRKVDWFYCYRYFKKIGKVTYFYWYLSFFDWLFPYRLPSQIRSLVISYQKTWNFLQKILFITMKHLLFYPKTHTYSDMFKQVSWAIMDKHVFDSFRRRFIGSGGSI